MRLLGEPFDYIRERDRSGALSATGLEWGEARMWLCFPVMLVMACLFIALICFAVMFAKDSVNRIVWFTYFCADGLVVALLYEFIRRFGERANAVIFNADGSIETPFGRPEAWWIKSIDGDHRYILSIEAQHMERKPHEQCDPLHEVVMYGADGDIILVAHKLTRRDAHKIAVLLTQALKEMREALANQRAPRASARRMVA